MAMKFMLCVCCIALSAAASGQKNEFGWLIGTWQETKNSFEVWLNQDSLLAGRAYQIDHTTGKQIESEVIRLVKKGNDFFYIPDVAGPQNPVKFKITSFNKNSFIAENPSHDFPKKISYRRTGEMLEAVISDESQSRHFTFKKIK
jgi:hypothetical protein